MPGSREGVLAPRPAMLALAAVLTCLLAGAAAPAARAAADLGAPSYSAYCQHIGFVDTRFTPGPNKTWGCLHSDGTITPLDIQAACEFTYSQRPISARELTPGAIYTWHCLQSAAGGGSGTGPGTSPTSAQLKAALLAALVPSGRGARIAALLRRGYSDRFRALTPGRVSISWYFLPKGARLTRAHPAPLLIARGTRTLAAAGLTTIKISLTASGRRRLAHAGRLRLTARGVFTPRQGHAVTALRAFTLKR